MTNEDAILRLAGDNDDEAALMAIAENNLNTLNAAIQRYFGGRVTRKKVLITLLIRISWRAKYFIGDHDDAEEWIAVNADMECRRLQSEVRGAAATIGRTAHAVN
jgi:hypothetical protein